MRTKKVKGKNHFKNKKHPICSFAVLRYGTVHFVQFWWKTVEGSSEKVYKLYIPKKTIERTSVDVKLLMISKLQEH
jgi:hypothetical protein